jgi:hypothetical protein
VPPSAEILPGGSVTQPWRFEGEPIEAEYGAGGAYASIEADEAGELRVSLDGAPAQAIAVPAAGLIELAAHPAHEQHTLRLEADPQLAIYSVSFSAGVP